MNAQIISLEAERRRRRWPDRRELAEAMLDDMRRRGHSGCALLQEERDRMPKAARR